MRPARDPMLMITPRRSPRMAGRTAFVTRTTPKKFVSSTSLASASGVSSMTLRWARPALLTSTSIRPTRSSTCATQASTAGPDRTSNGSMVIAAPKSAGMSRYVPKTRWPRAASVLAIASPIPELAPVTRATVPPVITAPPPDPSRQVRSVGQHDLPARHGSVLYESTHLEVPHLAVLQHELGAELHLVTRKYRGQLLDLAVNQHRHRDVEGRFPELGGNQPRHIEARLVAQVLDVHEQP